MRTRKECAPEVKARAGSMDKLVCCHCQSRQQVTLIISQWPVIMIVELEFTFAICILYLDMMI